MSTTDLNGNPAGYVNSLLSSPSTVSDALAEASHQLANCLPLTGRLEDTLCLNVLRLGMGYTVSYKG